MLIEVDLFRCMYGWSIQKMGRPAMREQLTLLLIFMLCAGAISCGTKISVVYTGTPPRQLYSRPPETVEVYSTTIPTRPFVEVAIMEARQESGWSTADMPQIIEALRGEAAKMGCDAIILTGSADKNLVAPGSTGPYMSTPTTVITMKGYGGTYVVYSDVAPVAGSTYPATASAAPPPAQSTHTTQPPVTGTTSTQPSTYTTPPPAPTTTETPPASPPTPLTPEQEKWLRDLFTDNEDTARQCLENAGLAPPATVGIEINPDGSFQNWGCKEAHLQKTPACECILTPFINLTYWPTPSGFQFYHIYY
jgi:hypothetical protein